MKPIMIALEADASVTSDFVDRANAAVDDFDNNFLVGKFYETLFYSLYRTCTSALR